MTKEDDIRISNGRLFHHLIDEKRNDCVIYVQSLCLTDLVIVFVLLTISAYLTFVLIGTKKNNKLHFHNKKWLSFLPIMEQALSLPTPNSSNIVVL